MFLFKKTSIVSTVSQVLFEAFILESFSFVTSLTHYLLVFPKECDFPSVEVHSSFALKL